MGYQAATEVKVIQAVPQSNLGEYTNQHNNTTNIQKKLKIPKILSSQKQIP
jgi:hypothetical protein